MSTRATALTLLALVAFASNSLLTRLALGQHRIDAATFTAVRLASGALVLVALVVARSRARDALRLRDVRGPLALFAYAAPFSFAYLRIGAAVGALVLFGVVQLTMIGYALVRGERPRALTWAGVLLAIVGFAILTVPSATRPDPLGLALMTIAGVAWGIYTLLGRGRPDPIAANAGSFLWSTPLAVLLLLARDVGPAPSPVALSMQGIILALVSGAITSGLGYAIWYRALPHLTVMQAAVAQLAVPVIAAAGAIAFLGEHLSTRLVVAGIAVLGGVALVLVARTRR